MASAAACDPGREGAAAAPRADRALTPNTELVQGSLKNGMAYIIRPRPQPAGQLYLELAVRCGSMHEPDGVSGAARLLARLPFGQSARYAPGEAARRLDDAGIELSRSENVEVDFDSTRYSLTLPRHDEASVAEALRFLADCAGGIITTDEAVDKERRLLLGEERGRLNIRQRIVAETLPRVIPGSRLASHPPEGRAGSAAEVTAAHLAAMLRDWWRPSRMTLIIIGDTAPAAMIERVSEAFSAIPAPAAPGPEDPDPRITPREALAPVVTTDPDLWNVTAQWLAFEGAPAPVTRESEFRAQLVRDLAVEAMQRRLTRGVISGRLEAPMALAASGVMGGAVRYATIALIADRTDPLDAARMLAAEIGRARRGGFTAGEAEEARAAVRAEAERRARAEPTLDAPALADAIFGALRTSSVIQSSTQRLELTTRLLPAIADEEISRAFTELSAPERAAVIVVLGAPGSAEDAPRRAPGEDELLAAARDALDAPGRAEPDEPRPASFLDEDPPASGAPGAGRVASLAMEPSAGVSTARLGNGVLVHHRALDDRTGQVRVVVTLAAGRIEETPGARGLTEAAAAAWTWPAACSRSGVQIESLRLGKDIRLSARAEDDMVQLTLAADSALLPEAMRFLHLMLREPRLEPSALSRWKWRQRSLAGYRRADPIANMLERLPGAVHPPGDPRFAPLTPEDVERIDLDAAQRRLETLVAAPLEAAIVGDVRRTTALELAAQYLGTLPERDPPGPSALGEARGGVPVEARVECRPGRPLRSGQGACLIGLRVPPVAGTDEELILGAAQDILGARLNRLLREERQRASALTVRSVAARSAPSIGALAVAAACDPAELDDMAQTIRAEIDRLAAEGPTPEEFRPAMAALVQRLEERARRADLWAEAIADAAYRGWSIASIADMPRRAAGLTPERLREALTRWNTPEHRFETRSTPEPPDTR